MADLKPGGEKAALCFEDLRAGQRFLSGTHLLGAQLQARPRAVLLKRIVGPLAHRRIDCLGVLGPACNGTVALFLGLRRASLAEALRQATNPCSANAILDRYILDRHPGVAISQHALAEVGWIGTHGDFLHAGCRKNLPHLSTSRYTFLESALGSWSDHL
jgi:hypothetical protein